MIRIRAAQVTSVLSHRPGLTEVTVQINDDHHDSARAYNYDDLTGPIYVGDDVVLNTTAVAKKLGTGGVHFVMANITSPRREAKFSGHIMKMRYSPAQVKVLAVEEPDSHHFDVMQQAENIGSTPVLVGTLHSMLAPAAAGIKEASGDKARVVYIMTDGAALPLALSHQVALLKEHGLIDATITCGHAFGGDYEAVNIYTALLAAVAVAKADVVVVTMGPGIVGTASRYGFTGVEQGEIINAVNILGGRALAIPRISFADPRPRHRGLSHHTITALSKIALTGCTIVLPRFSDAAQEQLVLDQISGAGLPGRHQIVFEEGQPALNRLEQLGIKVTSMGRTPAQDPCLFLAAASAGMVGGQ